MLATVIGDRRINRRRLRRRQVICTAATGHHNELLDLALPALRAYAWRHWFDVVVVRRDTAFGRPASWGKLPILSRLLDAYETVVWIDADAMVVDLDRSIAEELRPGQDLYLPRHIHQPTGDVTLNAGVMMVRATDWTRRLLAEVWAQDDLVDHPWWETAALMRILGYRFPIDYPLCDPDHPPCGPMRDSPWMARTRLIDATYNSIPHWDASPHPVIVHYAGLALEERRAAMLADLGRLASRNGLRRVLPFGRPRRG